MNSETLSPNTNAVKIGALVPSYNEAKRISRVLRVLLGLKGLDEILVVDDGSTDGTSKLVHKHFPQVKLVTLSRNQGKAGAVLAGALHTDCDFLLLMDADLQDLVEKEVEAGLREVRNNPETDMIIFVRMAEALWAQMVRGNDLFSGERIIRRQDLLDALRTGKVQGYQLEVSLNEYMIERKKLVRRMRLHTKSMLAAEKVGVQAGMRKETEMIKSIVSYLGLRGLIRQYLWFPPHSPN